MKSRGKMMKRLKFPKRIIALLCGVTLCIGGLVTAYAGSDDPMPFDPDPNPDPVVTEQVVTDPPIQTDPPIETIPIQTTVPVTEPIVTDPPTTVPVTEMPTTLPQVQTEPVTEGGGGIIDDHPDTTEFVPPTIPKTVSEKSYSTNYAFGIISWICVLVGVIVIISVAASTKASAYRSRRRRI